MNDVPTKLTFEDVRQRAVSAASTAKTYVGDVIEERKAIKLAAIEEQNNLLRTEGYDLRVQ
jgi:hypothetical protein